MVGSPPSRWNSLGARRRLQATIHRLMVVAGRSVCGAPLKAATIGLWPVDDFHRIAQGYHRYCSRPTFTKFARSYGCRARAGGMVPRRTSRTNADSRAKPDSNLENHSMLASFAGIRVRGPCCEDTQTPGQLRLLAGLEHGRTSPLSDIGPSIGITSNLQRPRKGHWSRRCRTKAILARANCTKIEAVYADPL
jgi:hypothetical protein